ncbi:MAG TPA: DUF308 domain-containing protein [Thermoanaerobaculia bacterium]|nr:DUF308 domain-containing protein [Thermoanaerobaculia bacterium]
MSTDSLSTQVSKQAGWSLFMGFLTAAIGVVMIIYPMAAATVSTLFFGWALIFAGVAQVVFAFSSQSAGSFFLKLLVGIVYGFAGVTLVAFPPAGVITLTAAIGIMLLTEAVIEIILAFSLPIEAGRGWLIASAIASGLLGVLILAEWPASAVWAIGTMVGVAVLFNGISRIVISSIALKGVHDLKQIAKAA